MDRGRTGCGDRVVHSRSTTHMPCVHNPAGGTNAFGARSWITDDSTCREVHHQILPRRASLTKYIDPQRRSQGCDFARSDVWSEIAFRSKAWGFHVNFGSESQSGCQSGLGQIENDPLTGPQRAENASLEGVVLEFDFAQIRVGQDDSGASARIVRFDDALHGVTWPRLERRG